MGSFRSLGSMASKTQVSSPHRHLLGRAWEPGAKGVSLCRRSVGLSDWKKAPSSEVSCFMLFLLVLEEVGGFGGELFDVVIWFLFPLDFGRADLVLQA